jgi:inhibitor of KinA
MRSMHWKRAGRDSLMVYFADEVSDESLRWSLAIASELEQDPPPGLVDFVPGYTSVLLQFGPGSGLPLEAQAQTLVSRFQQLKVPALPERPVKEIPTTYNGEDLGRVAKSARLSEEEVVALHAAPIYRVHLIGFTPGFPYLAGLHARLHTPRLAKPRLRVKAGAVGIGGAQTGIYTVTGPGGWNIIGHTTKRIYDPKLPEPFLLRAGDRVRFVAVG